MSRQKAIKVMSASLMAASAFVAASPAGAASSSNVSNLVKEAKDLGTILKWAISIEGTADGKTRPLAAYNAAKEAYDNAVKAVMTLPAAQRHTHLAELEQNVKLHINRTMWYIDALTAGEKIIEKQLALTNQLDSNLINDDTEKAYHELSGEIRKQALLLDRVYGQSTRELIRSQYKYSAEKIRDSAKYAVTVKAEIDLASKALLNQDNLTAVKHIEEARKYLINVDNPSIKKALADHFNLIAETTIPKIEKVTAVEPKRIKVEFSKAMISGNGTNSAENISNYSVSTRTIKSIMLSDDKKSAIIELHDPLNINSNYTVTAKKNIQTEDSASLGSVDFVASFIFSDIGKPVVNSVTADSNGNLELNFSELISALSPIAITIEGIAVSYSSLSSDADTVIVPKSELDRIGLRKGYYYSIVLSGATDLVNPAANVMDPYRGTFFY
ncbi:Ig-like domain-containing protein [Bacillus sp. JJ1503]|uniref:Ig-like domain-containing protein n=1 Tax=Bacillus sp. JJ1503 TaxID=3122956 RepID=UPI00300095D1